LGKQCTQCPPFSSGSPSPPIIVVLALSIWNTHIKPTCPPGCLPLTVPPATTDPDFVHVTSRTSHACGHTPFSFELYLALSGASSCTPVFEPRSPRLPFHNCQNDRKVLPYIQKSQPFAAFAPCTGTGFGFQEMPKTVPGLPERTGALASRSPVAQSHTPGARSC
jgi:hypothetical protein